MPKAEVMGAIGLLALSVNLGVAGLLYRYRAADSQFRQALREMRGDGVPRGVPAE